MSILGCDTVVALGSSTANGQTLFAKNSDRPPHEAQPLVLHDRASHRSGSTTRCQFVELPQVPTTWRHVGSRPSWCWGYEHGFNEHQVVIGNEGLSSKVTASTPQLIGMELVRLGLERGSSAAGAVEVITAAVTRYGQGVFDGMPEAGRYDNGYLVADPHEAYVIETAGRHWAVKRVEGAVGISNCYSLRADWDRISPGADAYAAAQGWWQAERGRFDLGDAFMSDTYRSGIASGDRRRARSNAVLGMCSGRIDVRTMIALLGDHSSGITPDEPFQTDIGPGSHVAQGGASICFHYVEGNDKSANTAASLIADLCGDGSRLPVYWCSSYSPCLGVFLPLFIEGDLPACLCAGAEAPSEDSCWWLFHRLAHAARAHPESGVAYVREQWAGLQNRLLDSAYEVAREARRLLDDGSAEAASRLVTGYMSENAAEVLARLTAMLQAME